MLNNDERTVAHQSQDKLLKMRGNVGRLRLLLSFFLRQSIFLLTFRFVENSLPFGKELRVFGWDTLIMKIKCCGRMRNA